MSKDTKEIVKPMVIIDPDAGREYTLEYSRRTVAKAERAGLDINKIDTAPMTMIPLLFWGAFLMHHPSMTKEQTDAILFDGLKGLGEAEVAYLGKLYSEPFRTLVSTEGDEANPRKMAVKF